MGGAREHVGLVGDEAELSTAERPKSSDAEHFFREPAAIIDYVSALRQLHAAERVKALSRLQGAILAFRAILDGTHPTWHAPVASEIPLLAVTLIRDESERPK